MPAKRKKARSKKKKSVSMRVSGLSKRAKAAKRVLDREIKKLQREEASHAKSLQMIRNRMKFLK